MSKYRLIALDIDGTLLNSRKEVAPDTLRAIRRAAEAGIAVVFCTGRAVSELEELYPLLPEIRYAVFASGSGLYDIQKREAFSLRGIPRAQAEEIMALAATKDMMPQIVLADRDVIQSSHMDNLDHYHMGIYRPLYQRAMTLTLDIFAFFRACRDEILKINMYHADRLERIRTRAQLEHLRMEKVYSEVSSLERSALGVNKGTGLLRLCDALGIDRAASAAVGDAENDNPMLQTAGLGIAMGNGTDAVKNAADRVAADMDHGGCAEAIEMILQSAKDA
jgi:Cof subfamily protein (haloacid dehalogenase superfamily)